MLLQGHSSRALSFRDLSLLLCLNPLCHLTRLRFELNPVDVILKLWGCPNSRAQREGESSKTLPCLGFYMVRSQHRVPGLFLGARKGMRIKKKMPIKNNFLGIKKNFFRIKKQTFLLNNEQKRPQ